MEETPQGSSIGGKGVGQEGVAIGAVSSGEIGAENDGKVHMSSGSCLGGETQGTKSATKDLSASNSGTNPQETAAGSMDDEGNFNGGFGSFISKMMCNSMGGKGTGVGGTGIDGGTGGAGMGIGGSFFGTLGKIGASSSGKSGNFSVILGRIGVGGKDHQD